MALLRINRHPSARDLRLFASLWLLFFGTFAWIAASRGHITIGLVLGGLAGVIGLAGLIYPPGVRLVYLGAIYVTFPIGFVLSHVILAAIYFLLMTPIGLLMRAFGRDPLQRKFEPGRKSYWVARTTSRRPTDYLRQH